MILQRIQKMTTLGLAIALTLSSTAQETEKQVVTKNGMCVSWYYANNRIFFEMSAPTQGWITIGFNSTTKMQGAYLVMGNVVNQQAQVVEHYTLSAGKYKPLTSLGAQSQVADVMGNHDTEKTTLQFSLPIKAISRYQKELSKGKKYHLILAYSREDDFKHHSIMRTAIQIKL